MFINKTNDDNNERRDEDSDDEFFGNDDDDIDEDDKERHYSEQPAERRPGNRVHNNSKIDNTPVHYHDDEDGLLSHKEIMAQQEEFRRIGFLETYDEYKEQRLQEGFEDGYQQSFDVSLRIGALLAEAALFDMTTTKTRMMHHANDNEEDNGKDVDEKQQQLQYKKVVQQVRSYFLQVEGVIRKQEEGTLQKEEERYQQGAPSLPVVSETKLPFTKSSVSAPATTTTTSSSSSTKNSRKKVDELLELEAQIKQLSLQSIFEKNEINVNNEC